MQYQHLQSLFELVLPVSPFFKVTPPLVFVLAPPVLFFTLYISVIKYKHIPFNNTSKQLVTFYPVTADDS